MRFGLDRMRRLMTALDSPHRAFRAIHVVGTNGKSSTVRMTAALLTHHGVAPAHTCRRISSRSSSASASTAATSRPQQFAAAVGRARDATRIVDRTLDEDDRVTQFEALTAAAYAQLASAGVDAAVVEAGLGGRWDATNVIGARDRRADERRPRAHALARPDDRRHRPREARRGEAIPPATTLVLGPDLHPDAEAEAQIVAARQDATIVHAPAAPAPGYELVARGAFQRRNFAVACTAAQAYLGRLDPASTRAAAASTLVPGRFEVRAGGRRRRRGRVRRRPQRERDGRAGRVDAGVPRRPAARRRALGARRQGCRRDARDAAAALRRGGLHRQRQSACAVARDARLARRPGRGGWPASTRVEPDPRRAVTLAT